MSNQGNEQGSGSPYHRVEYYDHKANRKVEINFKSKDLFPSNIDPVNQLTRMLGNSKNGLNPYGSDQRRMEVHHLGQRDISKGGNLVIIPASLHTKGSKLLHSSRGPDHQSTIQRKEFRKDRGLFMRQIALDIVNKKIEIDGITQSMRDQVKQTNSFINKPSWAKNYQPEPKPGSLPSQSKDTFKDLQIRENGIEKLKLGNVTEGLLGHQVKEVSSYPVSPKFGGVEIIGTLPLNYQSLRFTDVKIDEDAKLIHATINNDKISVDFGLLTVVDIRCLFHSVFELQSNRLAIDICASGSFFTLALDGLFSNTNLARAFEDTDFDLGALFFGRDAQTGELCKSFFSMYQLNESADDEGMFTGYKNPIREKVHLLEKEDDFAKIQSQFQDIYVHPTLTCSEPANFLSSSWVDWRSASISFKEDQLFYITWRLTMTDLIGNQSYYDFPCVAGTCEPDLQNAPAQAKKLLKPWESLYTHFKKEKLTAWMRLDYSRKLVLEAAKIFQFFTLAKACGIYSVARSGSTSHSLPKSSYECVNRYASFSNVGADPEDIALEKHSQLITQKSLKDVLKESQKMSTFEQATIQTQLGICLARQKIYKEAFVNLLRSYKQYRESNSTSSLTNKTLSLTLDWLLFTFSKFDLKDFQFLLEQSNSSYREMPEWWGFFQETFDTYLPGFKDSLQDLILLFKAIFDGVNDNEDGWKNQAQNFVIWQECLLSLFCTSICDDSANRGDLECLTAVSSFFSEIMTARVWTSSDSETFTVESTVYDGYSKISSSVLTSNIEESINKFNISKNEEEKKIVIDEIVITYVKLIDQAYLKANFSDALYYSLCALYLHKDGIPYSRAHQAILWKRLHRCAYTCVAVKECVIANTLLDDCDQKISKINRENLLKSTQQIEEILSLANEVIHIGQRYEKDLPKIGLLIIARANDMMSYGQGLLGNKSAQAMWKNTVDMNRRVCSALTESNELEDLVQKRWPIIMNYMLECCFALPYGSSEEEHQEKYKAFKTRTFTTRKQAMSCWEDLFNRIFQE